MAAWHVVCDHMLYLHVFARICIIEVAMDVEINVQEETQMEKTLRLIDFLIHRPSNGLIMID